MVAYIFNPSTQEAEAGGSLWFWGQPGLHTEFQDSQDCFTEKLCLKKQTKQKTERIIVMKVCYREAMKGVSAKKWDQKVRVFILNAKEVNSESLPAKQKLEIEMRLLKQYLWLNLCLNAVSLCTYGRSTRYLNILYKQKCYCLEPKGTQRGQSERSFQLQTWAHRQ